MRAHPQCHTLRLPEELKARVAAAGVEPAAAARLMHFDTCVS
jgi:hypothetical protein